MGVLIYGVQSTLHGRRQGPECRESENPGTGLRRESGQIMTCNELYRCDLMKRSWRLLKFKYTSQNKVHRPWKAAKN
jgi:hypothetical protein